MTFSHKLTIIRLIPFSLEIPRAGSMSNINYNLSPNYGILAKITNNTNIT